MFRQQRCSSTEGCHGLNMAVTRTFLKNQNRKEDTYIYKQEFKILQHIMKKKGLENLILTEHIKRQRKAAINLPNKFV